MGGVFIALVLFFVFMMTRLTGSSMELLFSNLEPTDSKEVISQLQKLNIPYETRNKGNEIYVAGDKEIHFVNKVSNMYDREFNLEALRYIYFCANNKDELEESVKKYIVKKIVYTKLEEFDINKTLKIIDDISILPNICLKINSKLYINKTNLSMRRGLTAVVYYARDEKIDNLILRILGIIKPTNGIPALKNGGVSIDMDNLTVTIDKADDTKTTVFIGRKYVSNRIISFCIKEHIGVAYIALPFNIYIPHDRVEV